MMRTTIINAKERVFITLFVFLVKNITEFDEKVNPSISNIITLRI